MNQLATIRRAYRYVVAYERRILDAIARTDEAARDAGFERKTPHRWWPLYSGFPSRDFAPDRSAWDQLPLYGARFQWDQGENNAAGSRHLLVDHVADTSYEARMLEDKRRTELDPLEGLPPAEEARSILRFQLVDLLTPVPAAEWKLFWSQLLPKYFGGNVASIVPTDTPTVRESGPMRLTTWLVDLETISGPEAFDAKFIAPLRSAIRREQ